MKRVSVLSLCVLFLVQLRPAVQQVVLKHVVQKESNFSSSGLEQPADDFYYDHGEICFAGTTGLNSNSIFQPSNPRNNGIFEYWGLNGAGDWFVLRHFERQCFGATGSGLCDQLWITKTGNPAREGSFFVQYGDSIVEVSYGPDRVSFSGELPEAGDNFIITSTGLLFVTRLRTSPAMLSMDGRICESVDGSSFRMSSKLRVGPIMNLDNCSVPINGMVVGLNLVPSSITVVATDLQSITPRTIFFTYGSDCSTETIFRSQIFSITGEVISTTTPETTTVSTTPEMTTPVSAAATTDPTTTTSASATTTSDSTPPRSTGPATTPINNLSIDTIIGIIVGALVAIAVIVPIVVVIGIFAAIRLCRGKLRVSGEHSSRVNEFDLNPVAVDGPVGGVHGKGSVVRVGMENSGDSEEGPNLSNSTPSTTPSTPQGSELNRETFKYVKAIHSTVKHIDDVLVGNEVENEVENA